MDSIFEERLSVYTCNLIIYSESGNHIKTFVWTSWHISQDGEDTEISNLVDHLQGSAIWCTKTLALGSLPLGVYSASVSGQG
jgi:hypothetical protein